MEFFVLGPLEVRDGDRPTAVRRGKPTALLTLLLLRRNEVVSRDQLIEALWAGNPPAKAANALHTYVSELRAALPDGVLLTRSPGYVLRVEPGAVDSERFEALVAAARAAADAADWQHATSLLEQALALWRGPAFADFVYDEFTQPERERLEQLRLAAVEARLDAELALGGGSELVAELEQLVREHPLRERVRAQLMVALYRAGRQADALRVYQEGRSALVEGLGLEPSAELKDLQRRILAHDPDLLVSQRQRRVSEREQTATPLDDDARNADGLPSDAVGDPSARRKLVTLGRAGAALRRSRRGTRLVAVAAVAAAVVVGAAVGVDAARDEPAVVVAANRIIRIDPETNTIVESIPVGRLPDVLLAVPGAVWVANGIDRTLSRVDTRTKEVQTIGGVPGIGAVDRDARGYIWASGYNRPFVWQIDPELVEVVRAFRVPHNVVSLVVGGGSVWTIEGELPPYRLGHVTRIDLATLTVEETFRVGANPWDAEFGYGALWVLNGYDNSVSVIRPGVREADTIAVPGEPTGIEMGDGAVWVGSQKESAVSRIEPDTRQVVKTVSVSDWSFPSGVVDVEVGAGGVWVVNKWELTVVRLDPRTNKVVATIRLPAVPRGISVLGDAIWVSLAEPLSADPLEDVTPAR